MKTELCREGRMSELMRERELCALYEISAVINSSAEIDEIMRRVLIESSKALGSEAAGIALREEKGWTVRYGYRLSRDFMRRPFDDEEFRHAVIALNTKKTAAITDAFKDERADPATMKQYGIRSVLAVPLRNDIHGCLFFNYLSAREAFDAVEADFAERTAGLVSLALRNARDGQIEEMRDHFVSIVESMEEAIISITKDLTGVIRTWNRGAEKAFGYSAGEAIGRNISLLVPPGHLNDVPHILDRIKQGQRIERYETLRMKKDGMLIYVSLNASPIRDAEGRIIGASIIAVDITRRRVAEEALKDSESKFRNIAAAAQDAVILIDNEGKVGFWNDTATRIFGYSSDEMIGKRLHAFIMPERYYDDHIRGFEAFRITGQGRFIGKTYEITAKRKDGTEFPVELSLAALKLKEKWNALGIVRDITKRKRAEEELKRVVDELEHSNKELERFAYVASHDLQEPLRTVSSYVELLAMRYKGKKLDENADKYIQFAVEGTNRMSTLISDLLAYSRVGTQGKPFAKIEMDAVLQEAINNLKKAVQENQAEITHDELPVVTGDYGQMVQLLQNLVGNAIKFRKKDVKPRIHVSAERKGNDWVFGVQDKGIGIEPRFYERIFTIFQRLHTKEEYPGTGVGLAICRRIVERHGGHIWVESKPGEGSSFYFTLPSRDKF